MGFSPSFPPLRVRSDRPGSRREIEWTQLSHDDLHLMLNRHKWQSGDKLFALRSDWTNAIVRYRKQYHLRADKIAYSGPVYSLLKERHQLGVETFTDSIPKQIEVLGDMITFMEKELELSLSVAVVSHNKLLKKILSPRKLGRCFCPQVHLRKKPGCLEASFGCGPSADRSDGPSAYRTGRLSEGTLS